MTSTETVCVNWRCERTDVPNGQKLCRACAACEKFHTTVMTAFVDFLEDQFPPREHLADELPHIRNGGEHLALAFANIFTQAIGKNVAVTFGPWIDQWAGRGGKWQGGIGWDISEVQDDEDDTEEPS